ncbi:hypothetical protein N2599_36015 (plasmid) [Rhizobium sullae]|uniref:Phospholipase/carboxylesterase n=1 Tax=Rhizobium sullae TaxID=50338 RepID=A0ABY5XY72_RHISU|nr:hypothetical protein [Rhizobium sullae]UWU19207.1 hypothetical protein N2599_36015 [Rhizobium sullae]
MRRFISKDAVQPPLVLGLSNGANILMACLYRGNAPFDAAIPLRPAIPFEDVPSARTDGAAVLIVAGSLDETVRPDESLKLAAHLALAGADVSLEMVEAGHRPVRADEEAIREWLLGRAG